MPYVKVKRGQHYLMVSTRRPDGTRGARLLAYLGRHRTIEAAMDDLTEKYEARRVEARVQARMAAAARRSFLKLNWVPARPWATEYVNDMPVIFHAQWMPGAYAAQVRAYWHAVDERGIAEDAAEKLKGRLLKLKQVAGDLERSAGTIPGVTF